MNAPNLPNLLKPDFVDVAGLKLEAKLAELRSQGAHVATMQVVENGLWRLRLEWPQGGSGALHGRHSVLSTEANPAHSQTPPAASQTPPACFVAKCTTP